MDTTRVQDKYGVVRWGVGVTYMLCRCKRRRTYTGIRRNSRGCHRCWGTSHQQEGTEWRWLGITLVPPADPKQHWPASQSIGIYLISTTFHSISNLSFTFLRNKYHDNKAHEGEEGAGIHTQTDHPIADGGEQDGEEDVEGKIGGCLGKIIREHTVHPICIFAQKVGSLQGDWIKKG